MTQYAFYQFEYGFLKIGLSGGAVTLIGRTDTIDAADEPSALSDLAFGQIREYLNGKRKAFDFPMEPCGTEFEKRVWRALRAIPYGETRTYREVAAAVGNPNACRAVGAANAKNPILIAVPCHRVIGSNGRLTGYAGGLAMKQALLTLERGKETGISETTSGTVAPAAPRDDRYCASTSPCTGHG